MLRAFAARSPAILLQKYGTLIVLEDDVLTNRIALRLQEIARPEDGRHKVINAHQLQLGGASGIQLLFR